MSNMDNELIQQLKDKGFPQPTGLEKSGTWFGMRKCDNGECVYYPTLSELINEIDIGFAITRSPKSTGGTFIIHSIEHDLDHKMYKTAEEAVANLYITLKHLTK